MGGSGEASLGSRCVGKYLKEVRDEPYAGNVGLAYDQGTASANTLGWEQAWRTERPAWLEGGAWGGDVAREPGGPCRPLEGLGL